MKAILRSGTGLFSVLLLAAAAHGQTWVSPVFKQPYPIAPSPSNTPGIYMVDAYGNWSGPHYYLRPPGQPFNGMLPGKTGQAIMQGYLPHALLMSKEGMYIGKVPMVGDKAASDKIAETKYGAPAGAMPPTALGPPTGPNPYPYAAPNPGMQVPYYGNVPRSTFPMQSPYAQPMPYGPLPMPYAGMPPSYGPMPQPMPYGPMPMPYRPMPYGPMPYPGAMRMMPTRPVAYYPYYGQPIWQVQNVMPMMPMMPQQPSMNNGPPSNGFQYFGPMQQFQPANPFNPFSPLQGPQPPQMGHPQMQLPRMEMMPPPQQRQQANFPTHPFIHSPRDFFMWGENMEDEMRLRNQRPFPVPQ